MDDKIHRFHGSAHPINFVGSPAKIMFRWGKKFNPEFGCSCKGLNVGKFEWDVIVSMHDEGVWGQEPIVQVDNY